MNVLININEPPRLLNYGERIYFISYIAVYADQNILCVYCEHNMFAHSSYMCYTCIKTTTMRGSFQRKFVKKKTSRRDTAFYIGVTACSLL